jgi:hypothetical protein
MESRWPRYSLKYFANKSSFPAPKRITTTTVTISEASATLAESSGGVAFEVKLADSPRLGGAILPPAHFLSPSAKGNQNDSSTPLTPESIIEKLKRAEERRLSLEQLRATLLAAENNRPLEVIKIKDQQAEGRKDNFEYKNFEFCFRI